MNRNKIMGFCNFCKKKFLKDTDGFFISDKKGFVKIICNKCEKKWKGYE